MHNSKCFFDFKKVAKEAGLKGKRASEVADGEYIRMAMSARKLSPVAGKKPGALSPQPFSAAGVGTQACQNNFSARKNSHQTQGKTPSG